MNAAYLQLFMERTGFPEEARTFLLDLALKNRGILKNLTEFFLECNDHGKTDPLVCEAALKQGCSPYSLWMLVLISASEQAQILYPSEKIFFDTFSDLRYKAQECFARYGIWGTFVAHWYPIFYKGSIVKLGRMEYETKIFNGSKPLSLMGVTLQPGERWLSMHIPASGEPFDRETRMESYRRAAEYFGKPLVCVCGSWLLYKGYEVLFPPQTNIGDFRKEFHMIANKASEQFGDGWRVFGSAWDGAMEDLPEDSSMQRAFKAHLLNGNAVGSGTGVMIFDGEKILTRQE